MLIMTKYTIKPHISKEEHAEAMAKFAEFGEGPGEVVAHWAFADGSGGINVIDTDDAEATLRNSLNYLPYLTTDFSMPVVTVDSAVPIIMDYLS
tara:strand:- start:37 stop:318 length:282 start_codon:yes stop_codon:yes gene_type:complete